MLLFLFCHRVDQLYLDTTYCKPEYDFPSQSSVISYSIDLTKKHLQKYPNTLIAVGSYTIGKERIFIGKKQAIKECDQFTCK